MDPFETERQLVESFADYLNRTAISPTVSMFQEFETTNGIADIVLAHIPTGPITTSAMSRINPRWLAALAAIESTATFNSDIFAKQSGLSPRAASSALKQFSFDGYVQQINSQYYQKTDVLQPIVQELCAVEAKLRDWRRALYQAYRYQDFSHKSWVLLDARNINPALKNLDDFIALNVGLAAIGTNQEVRIYFDPTLTPPRFQQPFWLANCLVARALSDVSVSNRTSQSPIARDPNVLNSHAFL